MTVIERKTCSRFLHCNQCFSKPTKFQRNNNKQKFYMTKAITENPEVHRRSTTKNIHKCISKTFVLLGAKLPPQQNLDSAQLFWMLRLFFCLLGVLLLQHFRATIFLKINILPFFIWSWNVILLFFIFKNEEYVTL